MFALLLLQFAFPPRSGPVVVGVVVVVVVVDVVVFPVDVVLVVLVG
jgi:hypothetical protein